MADITYIKTLEGWLYLAVVMGLFSRKVVGWSLVRNVAVKMVKEALLMAIGRRKPSPPAWSTTPTVVFGMPVTSTGGCWRATGWSEQHVVVG